MSQLALAVGLADHAVFASYLDAGNEVAVAALRALSRGEPGGGAWLFGPPATGKSHLAQATCAAAGDAAVYLPASALHAAGPVLLEGAESRQLVCIDDVQMLAGADRWERALFTLYNELAVTGGQLLVTAPMAPRECPVRLPDLASRLSQLPTYRLRALCENDRLAALKLRARHRGLELPDDAARFLLTRTRRDMASLYALLDTLDREALRAQRRLTVPFVREVLARSV